MEIAEIIYEVAVEPSYKITRVDSKRAGNIRKIRGVAASSNLTLRWLIILAISIKGM